MAAIASNGTGGGVVSAGASWTGGVAPAEGDTCTIASGDTITIDANWTVGADSATPAIDVLNGGTLNWDGGGAADVVTCKGDFYVRNGGTLTLDGTADVTKTLTIRLNYSATLVAGEYGMIVENGAIVSLQGFNKTRSWDTLAADAAALQKNCVTTNDNSAVWYTTDVFAVGSMTRRSASGAETDTIGAFAGTTITKAGANYVYDHDQGVAIINLTRNLTITAYNTSYRAYILLYNQTLANFNCDWVAFNYMGSNAAGKYGITFNSNAVRADLNNCSFYSPYYALMVAQGSTVDFQNCVVYGAAQSGIVALSSTTFIGTVSNSVFLGVTTYAIDGLGAGATITGCHIGNSANNGIRGGAIFSSDELMVYSCNATGVILPTASSGVSLGDISFDNNACLGVKPASIALILSSRASAISSPAAADNAAAVMTSFAIAPTLESMRPPTSAAGRSAAITA